MKKLPLRILMCILFASCGNNDKPTVSSSVRKAEDKKPIVEKVPVILDIKRIAGQSPKQVEKIIGLPDHKKPQRITDSPCGKLVCQQYTYRNEQLEIVFINNKADWITIRKVNDFGFSQEVTEFLGLPNSAPDFVGSGVIRWKYVSGINEISIFTDGNGGIDYFYILCDTPT